MATLFLGVDDPNMTFRQDVKFAEGALPRILGYLMASEFGQVTECVKSSAPNMAWSPGEGQTEKDRPVIETQSWVARQASPTEAVENFAKSIVADLTEKTLAWEKGTAVAKAAAEAAAAIPPIQIIE